jgi:hypothetical protein
VFDVLTGRKATTVGLDVSLVESALAKLLLVTATRVTMVLTKTVKVPPPIHLSEHAAGGVQYVVRAGTSSAA